MKTQNFSTECSVRQTNSGRFLSQVRYLKSEMALPVPQEGFAASNQIISSRAVKHETEVKNIHCRRFRPNRVLKEISLTKNAFKVISNLQSLGIESRTNLYLSSNSYPESIQNRLRGGCPQDDNESDSGINSAKLLSKFQQYKEKILNDMTLEKELSLFVEVHATSELDYHERGNSENNETLELTFDIRKNFLNNNESGKTPKVLVLTGQVGIGKTLFCKHLQKELLSSWNESTQSIDSELGNWLPVYVDLSSLKKPKSEAISETLARELSITEEEILLWLQASDESSNIQQPHLLFIFDGYDNIEDINALCASDNSKDIILNNFCRLNKIEGSFWKNAKLIITCREESLQSIRRRDILFAPIHNSEIGFSVDSGSFLQRKIVPFNDEQMINYLKKFDTYEQLEVIEEEGPISSLPDGDQYPTSMISWNQVKKVEKLIDRYQLKEIVRTPAMLWIACKILSIITASTKNKISNMKNTPPEILRSYSMVELYVNSTINSFASKHLGTYEALESKEESKRDQREDENQKLEKIINAIQMQIQSFALRLSGLSKSTEFENSDLLKLHNLFEWDNERSQIKFRSPFFLSYFVAKSIEQEILKSVTSTHVEQLKVPQELLFNQRLFTNSASDSIVMLYLRDAIRDGRLTSTQFINLIHLSCQNVLNHEKGEHPHDSGHLSFQSQFAVAAANSITILNGIGYDFSHHDFRNVCIPGANLSYGIFEGTNFTNTNLQEVDFTGAWVKDAIFIKANVKGVTFGDTFPLKIKEGKLANIAFSLNGKYCAADIGDQTLIFENVSLKGFHSKEMRRLKGRLPQKIDSPFSQDEKHVITLVDKNSFIIWDIATGSPLRELIQPAQDKELAHFNSVEQELLFFEGKNIQKFNFANEKWSCLNAGPRKDLTKGGANSDYNKLLLIGTYGNESVLLNSSTGKAVFRYRRAATFWKLRADGKVIASGKSGGGVYILDSLRGHSFKLLSTSKKALDTFSVCSGSFTSDRKLFFSTTTSIHNLQDIASGIRIKCGIFGSELFEQSYAFNPYSQHIATVESRTMVSFKRISIADNLYPPTIRGERAAISKGLNLKGAVFNGCMGLSEENLSLLQQKGSYGKFNGDTIQKLIPNDPVNAKEVTEIKLVSAKLAPVHAKIIGNDSQWLNLISLEISNSAIEDKGGEVIGNNSTWVNLEALVLAHTGIGDKTAVAIANNQTWKNLKKLVLASNIIGNAGATAIGKSTIWTNLEILDLRQNPIEDQGAIALAENGAWKNLSTLDLSSNNIHDTTTLVLLCSNPTWKVLQSLMLQGNPISIHEKEDYILQIIEAIVSKGLEVLKLPHVQIDKDLLCYFKYSKTESVIDIALNGRHLRDKLAKLIGINLSWSKLERLQLSQNAISDEGGLRIVSNPTWINLQELDLSSNVLGAKIGVALGNNKSWPKLRILNLDGNTIGIEGACAIGKNTMWTKLQVLNLNSNGIEAEGAVALSKNEIWSELRILELANNIIGDKGVSELSKNTTWINLRVLNLGDNSISALGVEKLRKNSTWAHLEILDLSTNEICDEGSSALSKNTSWKELKTLILTSNSICAEGGVGLSKNTTWTNLQILDLRINSIDDKTVLTLRQNPSWPKLVDLHL